MGLIKTALAASVLLASSAAALDPIIMKGTKFFYKNGTQFYIKGVAYQQATGAGGQTTSTKYTDPLADKAKCERDVPILRAAGTNAIRTYAINPDVDHTDCMKLLSDAGIYVISDLSEPALSINRDSPAWNVDLFNRYKGVIDNLGKFDNTLGFFAGNEVSNNKSNTAASAYVKAAVRDSKQYIATKQANGGRWMGVGYAANDDADIRHELASYFNCGDEKSAIDFFGYNIYSWCGQSSFTKSGYDKQVEFFSNYSVPVFFAEYGCNNPGGAEGRTFDDTTALYSDQMTGVFSGGIVYMYFQEDNDYGLVKLNGDKATTMKNYDALSSKVAAAKPKATPMDSYNPSNKASTCPATGNSWKAAQNLPPTPDTELCQCMFNSLSCVPSSSTEVKDYGEVFDYICSKDSNACSAIKHDEAAGVYGPYVGCNATHQLGAVLNAYYQNQKSASTACDFKGKATVNKNPQTNDACKAKISAASASAAFAATATAGSAQSSSSGNPASTVRLERFLTMGDFAVGAYLLVAMGAGAGMVML